MRATEGMQSGWPCTHQQAHQQDWQAHMLSQLAQQKQAHAPKQDHRAILLCKSPLSPLSQAFGSILSFPLPPLCLPDHLTVSVPRYMGVGVRLRKSGAQPPPRCCQAPRPPAGLAGRTAWRQAGVAAHRWPREGPAAYFSICSRRRRMVDRTVTEAAVLQGGGRVVGGSRARGKVGRAHVSNQMA